ncbi:MAG: hypothetical protein IBX67_06135 [Dehalococcoidia bacterium]|nr:hypothetical protein [Dehalococcoidia bacterium]
MKRSICLVTGIVALSLSGCIPGSDSSGGVPFAGGGFAESPVEQAKEDLAGRKGIDKGEIEVVKVEAVNWPDTSLGCPQPDMMYAQVITPGFRILLSYAGETYVYHSDRATRVVYCPGSPTWLR